MQVTTIGLDIAKNVFQVHGIDAAEKLRAAANTPLQPETRALFMPPTRSRLLVTIGASPWRKVASLESEIHAGPGRISFAPPRRSWRDCLARLFGGRR